jgi:hypothetical protein
MKKTIIRIQPILVIAVSVLVLLICAAGIAGIWVVEEAASSATVQMLRAVDNVAQIMRDGITRVDTSLETFGESVSTVESASAQLSQNVSDKGLVLTLLPTTKEQELTAAAQSVRDDFAAIRDFLNATKEMVQAINRLPFINSPGDELASIETLQDRMNKMTAGVQVLKTGIAEFRSQAAANISQITQAITNLNNLLTEMRSDLAEADAELNTIQIQSRKLQQLLPIILLSSAIAMTLVAIWIGYSQFVMINRALRHLRNLGSSETAIEPSGVIEEPAPQEIKPINNVDAEVNDSPQAEANPDLPGNTAPSTSNQSSND